jgi:hypothetical protein
MGRKGEIRMARRMTFGLLPVALWLIISGCADQGSFEPAAADDSSLTPSKTRIELQGAKRGPGAAGGLKKDR